MSVKIIYFVHGTTIDNLEHKATGWNHGVLSEKGINQIIELKEQINLNEIDFAISSDLKRAITSAEYIFQDSKKIIHDKRIRECNYGDLNGKDSSLIKYENHINSKFPNGESLIDVEKRVRSFCNYLLKNYDGMKIALVAHRAPQLALDVIVKKLTWEQAIEQDWRKNKNWKPGWDYTIN